MYKINDEVNFVGIQHFTRCDENAKMAECKPGPATITDIKEKSAHPYHLIAKSGLGSNVYGWVNEEDLAGLYGFAPVKKMKYSEGVTPLECIMTHNYVYGVTGRLPKIYGVLWHSTGANNPNIKRYVQPDDERSDAAILRKAIGTNSNKNDWNHTDRQAAVHYFVGKMANGEVSSVYVFPHDYRPWGCGTGKKGSCNDGWLQFEICEDNLENPEYFNKVYEEGIQLTAYLCKMFNINPEATVEFNGVQVPTIICHKDSYNLGLGNNHGDIYHWFPKYGKSMEDVRADVKKLLNPTEEKYGFDLTNLKVGDTVTLKEDAVWGNGKSIPK